MSKLTKLIVMALLATFLAPPLAALAEPPPWAPAYGYRAKHYRYIYYPRYGVYYAPETQLWFWLSGRHWRFGASLPSGIVVAGTPGVSVVLGTPYPYEENPYVIERYGGPYYYRHHHRHYYDYEDGD